MPSHQPATGMSAVDSQNLSSQPSTMANTAEPNRNPKYDPKKPHIADAPMTRKNWYKQVNWLNVRCSIRFCSIPTTDKFLALPDYWYSTHGSHRRFLDAYANSHHCLGCHILLLDRSRNHCRLSSPVGSQVLLRNPPSSNLARGCWWWSC